MFMLQLIAMITMTIDHIGILFFPDEEVWRIIGRCAMPIYLYSLVQGYRLTRSFNQYTIRLGLIALIAQPFYMAMLGGYQINIIGTFLLILLLFRILDSNRSFEIKAVLFACVFLVLEILSFDYGAYALLLGLIYRYVPVPWMMAACHAALNVLVWMNDSNIIRMYSTFGTLLIWLFAFGTFGRFQSIRLPAWLWRSFYPAHLFILVLMSIVLTY
ncbi:TraX family protein [Marinicrinis lubricantis]|uniref:TraX family protein n=1 Tax=Marinicrinis lubricantis TaxID=2086470 RepID=A0ABW1IKW8_9BACL